MNPSRLRRLAAATLLLASPALAAERHAAVDRPQLHALVGAHVIVAPGEEIAGAVVVVRDGRVASVGRGAPPAGARTWDVTGMTIWPALVEPHLALSRYRGEAVKKGGDGEEEAPERPEPADVPGRSALGSENPRVHPELRALDHLVPDAKTLEALRSQGFATACVVPDRGILRGEDVVVGLADGLAADHVLAEATAQHAAFETSSGDQGGYPDSVMGATAVIRQALLDAAWYRDGQRADAASRPGHDASLVALAGLVPERRGRGAGTLAFACGDLLDVLRAGRVADEFGLRLRVRAGGDEYRRLDEVAALGAPVIAPVAFPAAPVVADEQEWIEVPTEALRHWRNAPDNPRWLHERGVDVSLTTDGLDELRDFGARVRRSVERGLHPADALAMATVHPARLLGLESEIGTLRPGRRAHLVVSRGRPFEKGTEVREVWVDGARHVVSRDPEGPLGAWDADVHVGGKVVAGRLSLSAKGGSFAWGTAAPSGAVTTAPAAPAPAPRPLTTTGEEGAPEAAADHPAALAAHAPGASASAPAAEAGAPEAARPAEGQDESAAKPQEAKVEEVRVEGDRIAFVLDARPLGLPGEVRVRGTVRGLALDARSDDGALTLAARRTFAPEPEKDAAPPEPPLAPPRPVGGPLSDRADVLVRDATVWTSGERGRLERTDVLVLGGRIAAIGLDLVAPKGVPVVDAAGRHLTPGLIDAHSHTAIVGGVNEGTHSSTAEVRIGDVLNSESEDIYRLLAGGLTTAHLLHGSANCQGGQSQVIKMRWGAGTEGLKFREADPSIKFALGENVKQSNWGEKHVTRHPQTRMGVEQFMREQFALARDYDAARARRPARGGAPVRRDLRLDALAEILRGERTVHCHSYRQDEILMLMRVAEDFGFRIGTFQHVLEGYKVADEMARHGAMASCFTDWWAYKFEVYDAIPHAAAIMRERGVTVSVNSDSTELARRMNFEAAKVVKWGGVPPEDALAMVTINPARQLGVDDVVGSIEVGKHADLALWSGDPLSTSSRCLATWVDGWRYFDRDADEARRADLARERSELVEKARAAVAADEGAGAAWNPRWLESEGGCMAGLAGVEEEP